MKGATAGAKSWKAARKIIPTATLLMLELVEM
jgi:hypothetical protein